MKTQIPDHLPEKKREELDTIVKMIKKYTKPEYIILFGSYARGNFVEYDETTVESIGGGSYVESFESDFDVLVIVQNEKVEQDFRLWRRIEDEIKRNTSSPLDLIVHHVDFINQQLSNGVPFFRDIQDEGIVLHDRGRVKLSSPKTLSPEKRLQIAQQDFEMWSEKAKVSLNHFDFALKNMEFNKAAFELHQAVESLLVTLQLVFTRYNPKEHDITKLSYLVTDFGFDILKTFPQDTPEEKHLYDLLRRAYVDARYSPKYAITADELDILSTRVKSIEDQVHDLCTQKIKELEEKE